MIDPVLLNLAKAMWPYVVVVILIVTFIVNTAIYLISDEREYRRVMKLLIESEDVNDE